jgi:uncharacterized protein
MNRILRPEKSAAGNDQPGVSRRRLFERAAMAASVAPLVGALKAQAPQGAPGAGAAPQGGAQAGRGRGGGRGPTPGGTGPINVLLITKFHPFNREPFFQTFDSFGKDITWTHVEQPAAQVFFNPDLAKPYHVFVLYDAFAGRVRRAKPDGTFENVETEPSAELRQGFKALLQQGNHGFVFFHHAIASWVHTWPEYVEVMGAAADWGMPLKNIRGVDYPYSGFRGKTHQHITVVDKNHPVTQGVSDFDIVDETYLCPMFEDSVHPLLRTDFKTVDSSFEMQTSRGWHHPPGSNMTGWVKTAENTPVVYIQHGHDEEAWQNPAFRTLMLNAIKWVNTSEAKSWAKANPSKIFKS